MGKEILRFIIAVFFSVFYRVQIIGIENIPKEGAAILCSNHISELDMFFIGYRIKRLVRYMAKEELFKNPLLRFFITRLGAFPVKRGKGDVGAIKTSLRLLSEGHIVGIFPEGTRKKTADKKNKKIKVKAGAALLAQKSQAPILPVLIDASYKPFSKVRIIFGKPFTLDLDKNKKYTNSELLLESEKIMKRIYSLMEE
ncbi:MAG TPA: 1-acyl-sn-glycerol-3-phosphate acyltransferase [Ruminiclostridium sp.]|jgi:1-acyl-sn-glycerol-3-phosphate acyltransferase|uniref:1-acyl-sn-glycerol-3-phosphate acyltransferase n=1 Tax=Acetivibrio saccincola TaxID=1677857 RepID=A0A2K9EBL2_9FIRM|nr:lysophospholipid acyltransferase family protein [Acetivibrio saccincola]HAA43092.1 1-acyl-sn-glycerol-3-phosphate acyltransferase [Ruminiclostridium sp.]AUG57554.1 1-acyl-sn-glycerol-3-phosphate acyltransferase [Acetivibrio saccincola]NLW26051.1 1-acyl-sn-glycerol-3-phosphate acyltransferase [Acetivibrio saccincola]PQQ67464.1 1-acyl-sn-glycerol-3-phosphate acyltransferase [Acetivibrio saccincola]HQD29265.1 lysophospholipid acyltransferase family protein [Acetivibrio saccincola]